MYWDQKFFESTRGKVVTLLRRGDRTVEELAQELDLTDNGVRVHLATLERDGIVRQRGSKRHGSGSGKPAYIYELTPEAEELFPKAYETVLGQLLDVLAVQLGPQESEALLRSVGRRLAEGQTVRADEVRGRLEAGVGVLNKLGGLAELEECDGWGSAGPSGGVSNGGDLAYRASGCATLRALRSRREASLLFRSSSRWRYPARMTCVNGAGGHY
jgi:predicted ArsR family transcriptional regulator